MSKVVTIASQKGGTGKSTLAINLAVLAGKNKGPVAIVDADEHGGLSQWRLQRDADLPVVAQLGADGDVAGLVARCKKAGAKLVIVDTPAGTPRQGGVIAKAIDAADMVVMTSKAGFLDIMAARPTADAISRAKKTGVVVLNDVPARGSVVDGARTALAGFGLPVCPSAIAHRVAISYSLLQGQALMEYAPKNKGVVEFAGVWRWLEGRMKRV